MTEEENSENIKLIRKDIVHMVEKNEMQHGFIIEKIQELTNKITVKHVECSDRFVEIEDKLDDLKTDFVQYKAANSGKWMGLSVSAVVVVGLLNILMMVWGKIF